MNEIHGRIVAEVSKACLEGRAMIVDEIAETMEIQSVDVRIFLNRLAEDTDSQNIHDYLNDMLKGG